MAVQNIARRESLKRWLAKILQLGAIGYGSCCILLYFLQRSFIYHPDPAVDSTGQLTPLPSDFEPWQVNGELVGYKRVSGAKQCIFFLHGNAGNARGWSHAATDFPGDIFVLEYPGYGERPGQPNEATLKKAALTAFDAIPSYPKRVVCGESLGSGVSQVLIAHRPEKIDALVLITPFTSLKDVASRSFPLFPTGWLLKDKMRLFEDWTKFPGFSSVVLAEADEVLPRAAWEPFRTATGPNRSVLTIPGATHNDIHLSKEDWERVTRPIPKLSSPI